MQGKHDVSHEARLDVNWAKETIAQSRGIIDSKVNTKSNNSKFANKVEERESL